MPCTSQTAANFRKRLVPPQGSAFKGHRYYGHHGRRHAVLGTQGRQTDEVGSAQAEDGRTSTSRRSSAPQLRELDLSHRVCAQCQRSTPVAPQLADIDFSQPAAADTSTLLAWAAARQLVDRAITSKPPELADGRSVHPPGMDAPARPVARPEHVTAVLVRAIAVLARFSLDTSYSHARRHAGTRAATSRGSETC